jgi:hypothetical protein
MDTLTSMKVFRQVVEFRSFVAAAEHLNFSTANVSKHVMSLEKRLGVRLLNRSSRALSLTEPVLYIVYSSRKFIPLKIRTFADFLLLELARREETQQRRCAPLEVGVSTTNESSRSRLALMAPVV